MRLRKWNYKTKAYDPYEVPDDWKVVLYTDDMELPINCTSCGKDMVFGDAYTSQTIHTRMGFGYPVCEDCYEIETTERNK